MIEQLITDNPGWKLRLRIEDCMNPKELKHLRFVGEQYNDEGELTKSSTYEFFLDKEEITKLYTTLANGAK
jgi:hypothetical protein